MGDISAHFSSWEFECRGSHCCSHSAPIDLDLVDALEYLRRLVDDPLRINSGFRCLTRNREIESRDTSQHVRGRAADVALPPGITIEEFARMADDVPEFKNGGVGLYNTFIHVDVRGKRQRWDRREL